jgi:hypothetical protein
MTQNDQSLVIAYPHAGTVHQPFMKSMMAFREYDLTRRQILRHIDDEWGLYVAGNRNVLCTRFLQTGAQWLLFLDTDHAFDPGTVYQLLDDGDSVDCPIVSALYFGILQGNPAPMWWDRNERGEYSTMTDIEKGLQKIDAAGLGCCLINRRVLETMRAKSDQTDSWTWFGHDRGVLGDKTPRMGEDFTFFERARRLGFQVYGDGRVVITHMKTVALGLDMFLKLAETRKPDEPIRQQMLSAAV